MPAATEGTAVLTARRYAWLRIAVLLATAAVWGLILGPQERSMGTTIRPVYLHVSATMAGMMLLYGVAALALVRVSGVLDAVEDWLRPVWSAGLVLFALGYVLSLLAAEVAWGGVFWAEPRVRASVGVLAMGMVTWAAAPRLTEARWGHLVWLAAAVAMMVILGSAQRVIHPESPVQDVTPWSIRGTFYGLTFLMLLVGADLTRLFRALQTSGDAAP